jgi:CheY-like chemotaxis protein
MDTHLDTVTHLHVMVVEDDSDTQHILQLILEDAGYTVKQASDGMAALDLLRSSPVPLVVLLDWWLPKLDGIAVLQAIVNDAAGRSRHAYILMTAAPEAVAAKLARIPLIITPSVLAKPFGMKRLLDTVASAARTLRTGGVADTSPAAGHTSSQECRRGQT